MSAESILADWGDAQAMRVTAEMDAAEGRKLRFKVGAGRRRRLSGLWRGWRRRR